MASTTMTASTFLNGSPLTITKPPTTTRPCLILAKASATSEGETASLQINNSKVAENNGRRDLVIAAATAAAMSVAKIAMAEEEPKAGTPEAKKKYATVCVTMPTARICRKGGLAS